MKREEVLEAVRVMAQVPEAGLFAVSETLNWYDVSKTLEDEPEIKYWASFQIDRVCYGRNGETPLKAAVGAVIDWAEQKVGGVRIKLEAV